MVGRNGCLGSSRVARTPSGNVTRRRGSSLTEMMFAMVALLLFLGGYTRSVLGSMMSSESSHEVSVATAAARQALEGLKGVPFTAAFAAFNEVEDDDPGGVGTAPGAGFAVPGLQVLDGDPDGMVGRYIFPTDAVAIGELREDADVPALGMPRDLNLNGAIDVDARNGDYRLLPVIVRLEWRSQRGPASLEFKTVLADN